MANTKKPEPTPATTGQSEEELLKKIEELEKANAALQSEKDTLESEKSTLKSENATLQSEKDALEDEVKAQKDNEAAISDKVEQEEKMVKIKLPKAKKDQPDAFISINNRTWLIKRGAFVEVPECVYEVLQHQEEMMEIAEMFEETAKNSDQ